MGNNSLNGHEALANAIPEWVWYDGTDALKQGEAVCYNTDYGTATAVNARRGNRVERPSSDNNRAFAGVAARDYSAKSGGQLIEIYIPGSKGVPVALGVDTTINTGILSFTAGSNGEAGRFVKAGFAGRGSIVPRQTVTAVNEADMDGGTWELATDGVSLTVSDASDFAAGDTVVLLGGEDEGSDKAVVPGKYIVSETDESTEVVTLSTSAVDATPGAALKCTGYAYTGNPTCQADLLAGDESGGVEFISLPNAGGNDQSYMTGGVSYVCGGLSLAADAECELADGTIYGERKGFVMLGTLSNYDFVVDLVTAGIQLDGSTALNEINSMNEDDEACFLEWNGIWSTLSAIGTITEA